jgi:hypothetical protein
LATFLNRLLSDPVIRAPELKKIISRITCGAREFSSLTATKTR